MKKIYIANLDAFEVNLIKIVQGSFETVLQFLNDIS